MKRRVLLRTLRGRLMLVAALATLPAFLFVIYVGPRSGPRRSSAPTGCALCRESASREHAHEVSGAARTAGAARRERRSECDVRISSACCLPYWAAFHKSRISASSRAQAGSNTASCLRRSRWMSDNAAFKRALVTTGVAVGAYWSAPSSGGRCSSRVPCATTQVACGASFSLRWSSRGWDLARQADLPPNYALLIVDRNGAVLARSGPPRSPVPIRRARRLVPGDALALRGMTRLEGIDGARRWRWPRGSRDERRVDVVALPRRASMRSPRCLLSRCAVLALLALIAVASSVLAIDVSILRTCGCSLMRHAASAKAISPARAPLPGPKGEILDSRVLSTRWPMRSKRSWAGITDARRARALTHRLQYAREERRRASHRSCTTSWGRS